MYIYDDEKLNYLCLSYDYSEEYIGYDADGDGGEVLEFVPEFVTQPSQLKVQ